MAPPFLEPFRIKSVEPIPFPTRSDREGALESAGHNLFKVPADKITVDLLTDSGTGAMSAQQWSALVSGDESYAGARSFHRFEEVVQDLTGFSEVLPVHQGRGAERIVLSQLLSPGDVSICNTHFDTTRANVELLGAHAVDLPSPQNDSTEDDMPFGGDLDVDALQDVLTGSDGSRVRCVVLTITNNAAGGQPVSVDNVQAARKVCVEYGIPLLLDASRFAENAYLVTTRDSARRESTPKEVAREIFDLADGCWASLKKDGLANIGGMVALRDPELTARCRESLIASEGFPTYGGLAGRDLDALATGLLEVIEPEYLRYRAESTRWFGDQLESAGVPVSRPTGCHAVYVDAGPLLPHLPPHYLPGHTFACALYLSGAVRGCDLGTFAFGQVDPDGGPDIPAPRELVRLAVPRRVYTRNHLEHVVEAAEEVATRAESLTGYRIVEQPAALRHFTARLEPRE